MKTLANINDNINIKFNKTMTTISENAVRGRTKTPKGRKEMKRL